MALSFLKNIWALKSLWVTVIAVLIPLPLVVLNLEGDVKYQSVRYRPKILFYQINILYTLYLKIETKMGQYTRFQYLLHTQRMDVDEGSSLTLDLLLLWISQHGKRRLHIAKSTKICVAAKLNAP